jgi:hypothetical protein
VHDNLMAGPVHSRCGAIVDRVPRSPGSVPGAKENEHRIRHTAMTPDVKCRKGIEVTKKVRPFRESTLLGPHAGMVSLAGLLAPGPKGWS